MDFASRIEGILFFKAEPVTIGVLARIAEITEADTEEALKKLEENLRGHGIVLVREGGTVGLMTAPGLSETLEKIKREELKRDIGKAGAETLSIVAYNDSVTRAEIDHIRGVNSTFILRNLLIRGLVERIQNPHDQRSFAYRPTLELYAHLGITKKEELPNYHEMKEALRVHTMRTHEESTGAENTP